MTGDRRSPERDPATAGTRNDVTRRLLDAVPDAIVVFDADITIRYANRAATEFIAGDADAGSASFDVAALVHADDLARVVDEVIAVFARPGSTHTVRTRIVNGREVRPIEVCLVNMLDDPEVRGVVASFRDLRGEEALKRESDAKQRLLEQNDALHAELLERQAFQARLLQIQQSISRRLPVHDVLLAVVQGAHELLGDERIELWLDPIESDGRPTAVESHGGSCRFVDIVDLQRGPAPLGDNAREHDTLVVGPNPLGARHDAWLGMAVPIRDRDRIIGSLTVATERPDRGYREVEREMLVHLAEHASVALLDARTVESVQAAFTDPLTGLPNRALLMDRLSQSIERGARLSTPLAVMFIDLARFKGINDGYGHAVGDEVLAAIGRRIASVLRAPDSAARLGGDEFVVVLENTDATAAREIAGRILNVIREPIEVGRRVLYADATIGIVVALDGAHADCELLLRHADIAMYRAKTAGTEVVFFEASMQSELLARQELESELRGAITGRRLEAAFQPMIDLATGHVVGVEALARWPRSTPGAIGTTEFVTTAERIGAVVELDRLVWADACHRVAALPANAAGQALSVSLNISAKHLLSHDLVPVLAEIVAQARIAPDRVTLEITETELMLDVVTAVEQMWALRRLGVHLAIDDFGTGYSSLAYLQTLPVRTLKIDRAFIAGVDRTPRGYQLARTMVNLAHGLGLQVVAEGIEREAEADAMRAMGADLGQGYWICRPLDADALGKLLIGEHSDGATV